ncbi:MarR family winged helix-turn-helix transcriptional regulator [Acidiferrobacter sp.]|uniref:MarR family winged helix-turn-helix transcriptional regulator n=1 Tax=Acidiferrobacter sp. TaxID=1872107 RepID=UPI002607BF3A|nr:MarR family transcriptional regulator [Acidiferrobacter sp.]
MPKKDSQDTHSSASFVAAAEAAAREPFVGVLRELAEAYQAFSRYSAAHVRELGLTPAQFDVIATLGRTDGLLLTEVARKTLITKGTLTGIIDRLEAKGLVMRTVPDGDRRSFRATLTREGEALFARIFPMHIEYLKRAFLDMSPRDLDRARAELRGLRDRFSRL